MSPLSTHHFAPGHRVWHYTDFAGLQGILSGTLWASAAAYLNDTQEMLVAMQLAHEVLEEEVHSPVDPDAGIPRPEFLAELRRLKLGIGPIFKGTDGQHVFVSSFSERPDDLSQWRAYGGSGPSFALGFDPGALKSVAAASGFQFGRVRYDREAIRDEFRAAFRNAYSTPRPAPTAARSPQLYRSMDVGLAMLTAVFSVAALCKDPSFEAEQEWRLFRHLDLARATASPLPRRFRQRGSLVIPYVEVPLRVPPVADDASAASPRPLVEIMIGPSPHPHELSSAIKTMCAEHTLAITVKSSALPYRNW